MRALFQTASLAAVVALSGCDLLFSNDIRLHNRSSAPLTGVVATAADRTFLGADLEPGQAATLRTGMARTDGPLSLSFALDGETFTIELGDVAPKMALTCVVQVFDTGVEEECEAR